MKLENREKASQEQFHRIIIDAAKAVRSARKEDPTALQEISDSTDGDPFKVLIATVLSHRTRDLVTAIASSHLFAKYPDAKSLARANLRSIVQLIRPVGFYNTKARTIKKIARIILEEYNGIVPNDREKLMELPSVGPKTASCVLVYGFKTPAIPVDTHVHRIFNRLSVVKTHSPEQTEEELMRLVAKRDWLQLNEIFVKFGQLICRPIGPHCPVCPLTDRCEWYKENYEPKHRMPILKQL